MRRHLMLLTLVLALAKAGAPLAAQTDGPTPPAAARAVADGVFRWLQSQRNSQQHWPVAVETPGHHESNLYSGEAGVFLFLDRYSGATSDQTAGEVAGELGKTLVAELERSSEATDLGLFTGSTGLAQVLLLASHRERLPEYTAAVEQQIARLAARAIRCDDALPPAIRWNDSTDVISGTSGIGLFLLAAHARGLGDTTSCELAVAAGDSLLRQSEVVELPGGGIGRRWQMQPDFPREMPNYSHGTAGICDFLVRLHRVARTAPTTQRAASYDDRFLQAALEAGAYLRSRAVASAQQPWIPHHFPGGEELFYWGWCHGPVGTVPVFRRLQAVDPTGPWGELAQQAAERLWAAHPSRQHSPGYWNNAGLCCGSAGIGAFFLTEFAATGDPRFRDEALAIALELRQTAVRSNSTPSAASYAWSSAEHRTRPSECQTQTGLMQGAAGIGLFFLQLERVERGEPPLATWGGLLD